MRKTAICFIGLVGVVALGCAPMGDGADSRDGEFRQVSEPAAVQVDSGEGDVAALAAAFGVSEERVREKQSFEAAFEDWSIDLQNRYKDRISAIWQEPLPGIQGYVRFIGSVPDEVPIHPGVQGSVRLLEGCFRLWIKSRRCTLWERHSCRAAMTTSLPTMT